MESWIHVSPTSGEGNGEVNITLDANDSSEDRTAEVSVITSTLNKILSITQKGLIMSSTFMDGVGFIVANNYGIVEPNWYTKSDEVTEEFHFPGGYESGAKIFASILVKTEELSTNLYYLEKLQGNNFVSGQKEIGEYTYYYAYVEDDGSGVCALDLQHVDKDDMTWHTIVKSNPM